MARFFVPQAQPQGDGFALTGDPVRHARVLRLKCGEPVTVCDGSGTDYHCTVTALTDDRLLLHLVRTAPSESESRIRSSIYLAFPKADKLEHVIQKATELGANEIVAFPSARCVSRPDEKSIRKKLDRWQKIASAAAEQSRRGEIPAVLVLSSYADALARAATADLPVLFYENEQALTFRQAIEAQPFTSCAILTGPEGGFDPSEIEQAAAAGLKICTLGKRILRCETAPLCALSALQYAAGEF